MADADADACSLSLINGTNTTWERTYIHSKGMRAWDDAFPATLAAGEQTLIPLEVERMFDCSAEVKYALQGTSCTFEFKLHLKDLDTMVVLEAVWNHTPDQFVVFPPHTTDNSPREIGWSFGGAVSAGVFDCSAAAQPRPRIAAAHPTPWTADWMKLYGDCMTGETLCTVKLPGTHESGTYDMQHKIIVEWAKCQNLDFTKQLEAGARYFDMRVGYLPKESPDKQFVLVHEEFLTNVSLNDALAQITAFCGAHSGETLILDFHRFTDFSFPHPQYNDQWFPYAELAAAISKALGGFQNNLNGQHPCELKLGEIKGDARVFVSFNTGYYSNDALIPWINQEWQGGSVGANSPKGLYDFIESVMAKPPSGAVWAMMAAINSFFYPPQSLAPYIDEWFYGGSPWSMACNMIATDYIEDSYLVSNTVCSAIWQGVRRH